LITSRREKVGLKHRNSARGNRCYAGRTTQEISGTPIQQMKWAVLGEKSKEKLLKKANKKRWGKNVTGR